MKEETAHNIGKNAESWSVKDEDFEKVVEIICHSLRYSPHEWEETSQFIIHLPSKTRFLNDDVLYFFGVWDGGDALVIFNGEQLKKIRDAYQSFRKYRRTVKQNKVLSIKKNLVSFFRVGGIMEKELKEDNEPHIQLVGWEATDDDVIYNYRMSDGRSFSVSQNTLIGDVINKIKEERKFDA